MSENSENTTKTEIPNCWEFQDCSKEVCDTCNAYPNMGRLCWMVTGTKCAQGKYEKAVLSEKLTYCINSCNYYKTYFLTNKNSK